MTKNVEFGNEVLVEKSDKERLSELLREANEILEKYPYSGSNTLCHTLTSIGRAKSSTKEAAEWCGYLHTKE